MSLVEEGSPRKIRMANLAIVGSHSTNGVAAVHSKLLRTTTVKDLAEMFPERFSNKTNGVTPRRWLLRGQSRAVPRTSREASETLDYGSEFAQTAQAIRGGFQAFANASSSRSERPKCSLPIGSSQPRGVSWTRKRSSTARSSAFTNIRGNC